MTVQINNKKTSLLLESKEIFCALFILLLYFLLSNLWVFQAPFWRYDDPMLLQQLINTSLTRVFFDSEFWQMYGRFMPIPALFIKLNYSLAGLNVSFFYYNHLLVIYLISCATFMWLRSFIGNISALLAGLLFLAGIPTLIVANQIMCCPYTEGLFFVIMFLIFCQKIEASIFYQWVGAIFLSLAIMAHETFVVFLLYPFLKQTDLPFSRRLSSMTPAIICTAILFIYRTIILKGIGGYGHPIESAGDSLFGFFFSIGKVFFGEGWLALCAEGSIAFVFIFTILIYKNRLILRSALRIMGGACVILIMFLPAVVAIKYSPQQEYSNFTYHRYLFVSWWAFSCLLMALSNVIAPEDKKGNEARGGINRWRQGITIFFALFTIMFLTIQNQNNHLFNATKSSFDNLYRYAIGRGAGRILYCPDRNAFWYYDLQLKSLADVYMRPRLHLEYKNVDKKVDREGEHIKWVFDSSCSCFNEIKKDEPF